MKNRNQIKNKVSFIIVIVAITMAIGYNTYSSQNKTVILSNLVLTNIEALAQDENPPKLYTAVKGENSSNGSLKRTNDENGKCVYKLLRNVSTAPDCRM